MKYYNIETFVIRKGDNQMLTLKQIADAARAAAEEYPIKNIYLFGSYANGTATTDSDVDLLVEFIRDGGISLLTIISLKHRLEDLLGRSVDVISYPIPDDSILEIERTVPLYAA